MLQLTGTQSTTQYAVTQKLLGEISKLPQQPDMPVVLLCEKGLELSFSNGSRELEITVLDDGRIEYFKSSQQGSTRIEVEGMVCLTREAGPMPSMPNPGPCQLMENLIDWLLD